MRGLAQAFSLSMEGLAFIGHLYPRKGEKL